jgi:hypothetical protein
MVKTKLATLVRLAPALALFSCAAPKAIVVEQAPQPRKPKAAVESENSEPSFPSLADDGIRLPDMLAMPGASEFHATSPNAPKVGTEAGTVISRPPTDPPPRPKPKAADSE